ncbi:MAG: hypothetical protein QME74_07280, partial [Candidatus Edwardsbacteria bacterium]|nr:hypothetical protein [Candidatus Edwardsbacteria bacterium]
MDQDNRPDKDEAMQKRREPIRNEPAARPAGPHHGLFHSRLGKFAGRKDAAQDAASDPVDANGLAPKAGMKGEHAPPDVPVAMPAWAEASAGRPETGAENAEEQKAIEQPKKKSWWNIFKVKSPADESSLPVEDQIVETAPEPARSLDEAVGPDAEPYERKEIADADESRSIENQDLTEESVIEPDVDVTESRPSEGANPAPGFFSRLKSLKERLFPTAERPVIDEPGYGEEPIVNETGSYEEAIEPAPVVPVEPFGTGIDAAAPTPPVVDTTGPAASEETTPEADVPVPGEMQESEPSVRKQGLIDKIAFWKKRPAAEPAPAEEPLAQAEPAPVEPVEPVVPFGMGI